MTAEMPGARDPLRATVERFMVHNHAPRCAREGGGCRYDFPFGANLHTRVEETGGGPRLLFRRRNPTTDSNVVSYNRELLSLWQGHLNVVPVMDHRVFEYLLKYMMKGLEDAIVSIRRRAAAGPDEGDVDEMRTFISNRFMGASEACMVLFGGRSYPVVTLSPPVIRLRVSVPTANGFVVIDDSSLVGMDSVAEIDDMEARRVTHVERWLQRPEDSEFDDVGVVQYFERYVVRDGDTAPRRGHYWTDRHPDHPAFITRRPVIGRGSDSIARICRVPRSAGEAWYLTVLLRNGNPALGTGPQPRTWAGLRVVDGADAGTFESTARRLGYVRDNEEGLAVMQEMAAFGATPRAFRATLAIFASDGNDMNRALEEFTPFMSRDLQGRRDSLLRDLERTLAQMGTSLEECNLPPPPRRGAAGTDETNPLVVRVRGELLERRQERLREFHRLRGQLNAEQRGFVDAVMEDFEEGRVRLRHLDALPGRGKSFAIRVLVLGLRSAGLRRPRVVVTVASTGVAASQFAWRMGAPETDATTAHRRFRISVQSAWNQDEPPVCGVTGGSDNAALLRVADAIVWDEMGNAKRADMEAVDALLRELRRSERPFGGVYLVGLGEFPATLGVRLLLDDSLAYIFVVVAFSSHRHPVMWVSCTPSRSWAFILYVLINTRNCRLAPTSTLLHQHGSPTFPPP